MNRFEAVGIIREIFKRYPNVEGKSIKLLPPGETGLSDTFQIHVEVDDDVLLADDLRNIAEKHDLRIMIKDDWLIIYRPHSSV